MFFQVIKIEKNYENIDLLGKLANIYKSTFLI